MIEMKNPMHPGVVLGGTLEELGVTISAAARNLGITRQQLYNLIGGRSAVTPEMAMKLELALGSTAETWLRMQMNYDLAQVRQKATTSLSIKRFEPKVA